MGSKDSDGHHDWNKHNCNDSSMGSRAELRIWQRRYKRDGQQETIAVDSLGENQRFDTAYAIVVEQIFTKRNVLDLIRLTVNSPHILRAFQQVIRSYPTVAADFSEPFEMESPFRMLFHYWEDLNTYREKLEDDDARMHLNILFDFMDADLGPEKQRCESQIKKGQIDFSRSWVLYRPGELQITYIKGHAWLTRCTKTAYEENTILGKWLEVH